MPSGKIWGVDCLREAGWKTWAADPGWKVHVKTPVWGYALSQCLLCSPTPASPHCQRWAIPRYQSTWVRVQKLPWEKILWLICSHWQIYLFFSALVLSRSWEKFLPKCTLTCTSVLGTRKWGCCFWSDWDRKCKYVLYLNYLLGEAFILIKTFTLLTCFKTQILNVEILEGSYIITSGCISKAIF